MSDLVRVPKDVTVEKTEFGYGISWNCIELGVRDQDGAQTIIDMLVGESALERKVEQLNGVIAEDNRGIENQRIEIKALIEQRDYIWAERKEAKAGRFKAEQEVSVLQAENKELVKQIKSLHSHEAVTEFWRVWKEVGDPHKHGFYESTWMAFRAALLADGKCQIADKDSTWPIIPLGDKG